jgi:hypothetical protein
VPEDPLLKAIDLCSMGHFAHVQGLTFGAGFAFVYGYLYPSYVRRRRRYGDSTSSFDSI